MHTLESFTTALRDIVAQELPPATTTSRVRKEVLALLENKEFLKRDWNVTARPDGPRQTILYKDADYGFQVLAHVIQATRYNPPHSHGPCWVIYGVHENAAQLTNFRRLDGGATQGVAQLAEQNRITLREGQATGYVPGAIHATLNPTDQPTVLIRVTSQDLNSVDRERFDLERGTVEPMPAQA